MKIVKYIVEVSTEEWKASPHIHKYPYDTMGDVMRAMIPKDDYESLFLRPDGHETVTMNRTEYNVIAKEFNGSCRDCCFYASEYCCDVTPCRCSERADGRDVYFQPWQKL